MANLLVTGGAGFIGSHVIRRLVNHYPDDQFVNLDKLTYAGNLENLRDVLHYNPDTGVFIWLKRTAQRQYAGDVAGFVKKDDGYVVIKINRKKFSAHRLAWFYMTVSVLFYVLLLE